MKKFFVLLALLVVSSMAQATEVVVFEKHFSSRYDMEASYTINKNTNEVFVDVLVFDSNRRNESTSMRYDFRSEFDGLHFDPTTKSVVLTHEGREIECATMRPGRVFPWQVLVSTNCFLDTRRVVKEFNTHRGVERVLFLQAVIKINE